MLFLVYCLRPPLDGVGGDKAIHQSAICRRRTSASGMAVFILCQWTGAVAAAYVKMPFGESCGSIPLHYAGAGKESRLRAPPSGSGFIPERGLPSENLRHTGVSQMRLGRAGKMEYYMQRIKCDPPQGTYFLLCATHIITDLIPLNAGLQ